MKSKLLQKAGLTHLHKMAQIPFAALLFIVMPLCGCWQAPHVLRLVNNSGVAITVYYSHPNRPPDLRDWKMSRTACADGDPVAEERKLSNTLFDACAVLYPGDVLDMKSCSSIIKIEYPDAARPCYYRVPAMEITYKEGGPAVVSNEFTGAEMPFPDISRRNVFGGSCWGGCVHILLEPDRNIYCPLWSSARRNGAKVENLLIRLATGESQLPDRKTLNEMGLKESSTIFKPMRVYNR